MEKISSLTREEQIQEQVMDISMRIDYLAEKEPELLNYIQRTVEGLCIVDNDTIKLENNRKLLALRNMAKIKKEKDINIAFQFVMAINDKNR